MLSCQGARCWFLVRRSRRLLLAVIRLQRLTAFAAFATPITNGLDIAFNKGTTDEGGETAKVWNLNEGVEPPVPVLRSVIRKAVFSSPSVVGKVMTVNNLGSGIAAR